jgi:hypothetical protein
MDNGSTNATSVRFSSTKATVTLQGSSKPTSEDLVRPEVHVELVLQRVLDIDFREDAKSFRFERVDCTGKPCLIAGMELYGDTQG